MIPMKPPDSKVEYSHHDDHKDIKTSWFVHGVDRLQDWLAYIFSNKNKTEGYLMTLVFFSLLSILIIYRCKNFKVWRSNESLNNPYPPEQIFSEITEKTFIKFHPSHFDHWPYFFCKTIWKQAIKTYKVFHRHAEIGKTSTQEYFLIMLTMVNEDSFVISFQSYFLPFKEHQEDYLDLKQGHN